MGDAPRRWALVVILAVTFSLVGGPAAAQAITPVLITTASPSTTVGQPIFDNANLLGGSNPTGTITFNLYGPGDVTCATPIFTSTVPVTGTSVNSAPFTTTQAGTYRWTATYSGDANHSGVGPTACNDPAESVIVGRADVFLTTVAAPQIGGTIHDTATLAGGFNPTGTITFDLHGPGDTFCSGAPVFTSTVPVNGNGAYQSADFTPTVSGTYRWRASYSGDVNNTPTAPTACLDPAETVDVVVVPPDPTPTITTTASPSVPVGGQVRDTATLAGGTAPTGTITFDLYGPDDATCAGPVVFTSTVPVNGNGSYDSALFTPAAPGTYRWRATYSGDANNTPAGPTACTDPAEAVVVTPPPSLNLATNASGSVPVGGQVRDTATLAGGTAPTGTITFDLYGPDDATCAGPVVFTSTVPVNGNGSYDSAPFTATAPGTHRWRATYSGDANNTPVGPTACTDPAEAVVVTRASPSIVTNASAAVAVGGTVRDTATLSGGFAPTGTITFTLFGPDDATCTGPPAFTSTVPVNGNGNYDSGDFTATLAGTYRWVASYSGDVGNNAAGPTACTDPAEAVVVGGGPQANPTLATNASGSVPVGGTIRDTATLANGTNPTGTVTFDLYGPDDANCAGPVAFTSTVPVNGNGSYDSADFTPTQPGTYRWRASYSGDAANAAAGPTACTDPAEAVVVTAVVAAITVTKTADPLTRPEPGGTFTFGVVVTNTGPTPVTLTALTDDVYGNLAGRGTCAVGAVLKPNGGFYVCTFPGDFTGAVGASQTDTVTATAAVAGRAPVTATGRATVSITAGPPTIAVDQTVDSATKPEPGGTFMSSITVTNTSSQPLTLTSLVDEDLNGKGTCRLPQPLAAAGGTYSCTFPIEFRGVAGESRTFTTTATAVDATGRTATGTDSITLTLTLFHADVAVPPTEPAPGRAFAANVPSIAPPTIGAAGVVDPGSGAPPGVGPVARSLVRTGADVGRPLRVALALVVGGLVTIAVASARHPAPESGTARFTRWATVRRGVRRRPPSTRPGRTWPVRRQWPSRR